MANERNKDLQNWLNKHRARLLWQRPLGPTESSAGAVEAFAIEGRVVIVTRFGYKDGDGWDVYTSHGGSGIDATLADADERLKP